jgi:hypothetical protein
MGWKTINGRRYYYKSEREGGRIKTTYFGAGESGILLSLLHLEDRAEREAEREQRQAEKEEFTDRDKSCLTVEGAQRLLASIAIVHGRSVCTSKYRPSGENTNGP